MTAALTSAPPSPFAAWALATRPRTLVAGFVPVAVGSAVAWRDGKFSLLPALGALIGALLIQIPDRNCTAFRCQYVGTRSADAGTASGHDCPTQRNRFRRAHSYDSLLLPV